MYCNNRKNNFKNAIRRNQTQPCLSCRRHDKRRKSQRAYFRGVSISRDSGTLYNYHTPVRQQPDDRRNSQRAYFRGVIAPLSASFASEKQGEWTHVLDPRGERRKARGSKRERPVITPGSRGESGGCGGRVPWFA